MTESTHLIPLMSLFLSLGAGAILGFIYFFGLWVTLKQLPQQKNPGLLMLFSLIGRLALVLPTFYFIMHFTGWQGLLAALLGLTLVRLTLKRRLGPISRIQDTGKGKQS
jgi:F1F0 ATPase subunit 2